MNRKNEDPTAADKLVCANTPESLGGDPGSGCPPCGDRY
jgi:hypothetical protein